MSFDPDHPLLSSYAVISYMIIISYVPHAFRVFYIVKNSDKSYDVKNPRRSVSYAVDKEANGDQIQRLTNAHYNILEGMAAFIGGILAAKIAGVDKVLINQLAWCSLALRIVYVVVYGYGKKSNMVLAALRSIIFLACCFVNATLYIKSAYAEASIRTVSS